MHLKLNNIPNALLIFLFLLTTTDFKGDIAVASESKGVLLTTYSEEVDSRKFSEILITDVKGYRCIMGEHEGSTILTLSAYCRTRNLRTR
jgi:hypothetical protein